MQSATARDGASGALAGYRIRIVPGGVGGWYAGWLLGGLGAEVEWITQGGRAEGALERWLGRRGERRRHGTLPPLATLAADCDALLVDFGVRTEPRLAAEFSSLADTHPDSVTVALSPFGLSGPWAGRAAGPIELQALSGLLLATGDADHPPSPVACRVVEMAGGVNAANGVLLGLLRRARHGAGSWVDVSGLETLVCLQSSKALVYAYTGLVYRRDNSANLNNFLPCKDGYICGTYWHLPFETVLEFFGVAPSALPREVIDMPDRGQQYAHPEVMKIATAALAGRTRAEWIERAKPYRIPMTPVLTAAELVRDPHLAERNFFEPLPMEDGTVLQVPARPFKGAVWGRSGARRALQSHGARRAPQSHGAPAPARLPLEGLRVTEVGLAWSTPMATETFAQYGAEVIKLEPPQRIDTARSIPLNDLELRRPWWEHSANYHAVNAGKRHFGFNAAGPGARAVRERLLAASDIVLTNFSVRAIRNLGFEGEAVRKVNPRCSVVHSTGFGWDGPYRDLVAYGTGMEGMTGLALATGKSLGPVRSPLLHPDIFSSLHQMLGGLAALLAREASGEGTVIDLGQLECGVLPLFDELAAAQGQVTPPNAPAPPGAPAPRLLRCRGPDEWLVASPGSEEESQRLAALAEDALRADRHALADRLRTEGLCAAPLLAPDEVLLSEHLHARGYFNRVHSATFGEQLAIGRWHRFHNLPPARLDGVHPFGEDNDAILRQTLGFSTDEAARMLADGTVGPAPDNVPEPPAASSPVDWMVETKQIYRWDEDFRDKLGLGKPPIK